MEDGSQEADTAAFWAAVERATPVALTGKADALREVLEPWGLDSPTALSELVNGSPATFDESVETLFDMGDLKQKLAASAFKILIKVRGSCADAQCASFRTAFQNCIALSVRVSPSDHGTLPAWQNTLRLMAPLTTQPPGRCGASSSGERCRPRTVPFFSDDAPPKITQFSQLPSFIGEKIKILSEGRSEENPIRLSKLKPLVWTCKTYLVLNGVIKHDEPPGALKQALPPLPPPCPAPTPLDPLPFLGYSLAPPAACCPRGVEPLEAEAGPIFGTNLLIERFCRVVVNELHGCGTNLAPKCIRRVRHYALGLNVPPIGPEPPPCWSASAMVPLQRGLTPPQTPRVAHLYVSMTSLPPRYTRVQQP